MSNEATTSDAAFQEFIRVLEGAARTGVNALSLEYKGSELIVFYHAGDVGLGADRISERLQQAVINEIVKRAGLGRKSKGKIPIMLLSSQFEVVVEKYESFDDPAFAIILKERKKKADG